MRNLFVVLLGACLIALCSGASARKPPHQLSEEEHKQYKQMMAAIEEGNIVEVTSLLKSGIDLELREDTRASPTFITLAALDGQDEIVKALLSAGADVESLNGDGYTPLMCAVLAHQLSTARLLVHSGANVNAQGASGGTPLSLAHGQSELVKELVAAGAKE